MAGVSSGSTQNGVVYRHGCRGVGNTSSCAVLSFMGNKLKKWVNEVSCRGALGKMRARALSGHVTHPTNRQWVAAVKSVSRRCGNPYDVFFSLFTDTDGKIQQELIYCQQETY